MVANLGGLFIIKISTNNMVVPNIELGKVVQLRLMIPV